MYVEGGGSSKELHTRCREGFRKLFENAGFIGYLPGFVACGSRNDAYDSFKTAWANAEPDQHPLLLVDSEEPVVGHDVSLDSPVPWQHLKARDKWDRPPKTANDQAHLMVTCTETWIIADRPALRTSFGPCLQENALLPEQGLELRTRHEATDALEHATRDCGRGRAYSKGRRSFQLLALLDPAVLAARLPHFARFVETLHYHLG